MERWSFSLFRLAGTEIRLHLSLVLLAPYVWIQFRPESIAASLPVFGFLLAVFGCILLHEIGHTLASNYFGLPVGRIVLWPLGGFAEIDRAPSHPLHTLLIAAAGPLMNLLLAFLSGAWFLSGYLARFWLAETFGGLETSPLFWTIVYTVPLYLTIANLSLALFNLAPVYPLDGGQIVRSGLEMLLGQRRADAVALWLGLPFAAFFFVLGVSTGDYALSFVSLLLVFGSISLNRRSGRLMALGFYAVTNRPAYYHLRGDLDRAEEAYTHRIERVGPVSSAPFPIQKGEATGQAPIPPLALQRAALEGNGKRHIIGGVDRSDLARLLLERAHVYLSLGEWEAAGSDVEQALALNPDNYLIWSIAGDVACLRNDLERALLCCQQVIGMKPDWYGGWADYGIVLRERGDLPAALANLDHALRLAPGLVRLYLLRATVRFRLGDRAGARSDEERALSLSPEEALLHPLVFLHAVRAEPAWAEEYTRRAAGRLSRSPLPHRARGDFLRAAGLIQPAVSAYRRALALDPLNPEVSLALGECLLDLGRGEQARPYLEAALRLGRWSHLKRKARAAILLSSKLRSPDLA